jgi:putative endonuclease
MASVYILQSKKDRKYYIGCTSDIGKRLSAHNQGLVKSTKSRLPMFLIHLETFQTLGEARKRENKIKSYKGGEAFKKLINGSVPK